MGNLKTFLSGALNMAGEFVPGVKSAAKVVNALLPEGQKLDLKAATGGDVLSAYEALDDNQKAVLEKQFDVELAAINASTSKLESMVSAETATANTRPRIAYMMAWTVVVAVFLMMVIWFRAVWVKDADSLKIIAESWPLMLAVLGTPTALLRAYFGMRTKEKTARYAGATGQPINQAIGGFKQLFQK